MELHEWCLQAQSDQRASTAACGSHLYSTYQHSRRNKAISAECLSAFKTALNSVNHTAYEAEEGKAGPICDDATRRQHDISSAFDFRLISTEIDYSPTDLYLNISQRKMPSTPAVSHAGVPSSNIEIHYPQRIEPVLPPQ